MLRNSRPAKREGRGVTVRSGTSSAADRILFIVRYFHEEKSEKEKDEDQDDPRLFPEIFFAEETTGYLTAEIENDEMIKNAHGHRTLSEQGARSKNREPQASVRSAGNKQARRTRRTLFSPTTWAENRAAMAAGGMRSPMPTMAERAEAVIRAFLPMRARRTGTPRTEADPNAETPPKSGMLTAMPA